MPLLTHSIRFGEPRRDFVVNFFDAGETKRVKMIPRRKSFDPTKARILQPARENHVAIHPILPNHKGRETHPNLKRNSRFLRQNGDRPIPFREREQCVENGPDRLWFAGKMRS